MTRPVSLIAAIVIIFLAACTSNEIGKAKDVNPESVYFDYRVSGDDEMGDVTVHLQYRFAGPNGTTLVLEDPSKVELDGIPVPVDSSRMNGAYYDLAFPADSFAGRHTIVFTGSNGREYRENFEFRPFRLKTAIPAVVESGDLELELEGLKTRDVIRVMLTDTSIYSGGIERFDTVDNGKVLITRSELDKLASGPIYLELIREEDRPLKAATKEGGKMSFYFSLKREFELKKP